MGYLPSDDELTLAIYHQLLLKSGIEFKRDAEGYYYFDETVFVGAKELGAVSIAESRLRRHLTLEGSCPKKKTIEYLNKMGIPHVIDQIDNREVVTATVSDFERAQLVRHYASFTFDCKELTKEGSSL